MKYLIFIFLLFLGGCDYDNDTTIYTNYTVVKKEVYVLYKKQTINYCEVKYEEKRYINHSAIIIRVRTCKDFIEQ
jgi:hypothetical protein